MADFEAEIPHGVEHVFNDALAPRGLLVRQHEEEIDVRARGERPAPVAPRRDDGDAFGGRGKLGVIDVLDGEVVERADDLILGGRNELGGGQTRAPGGQHGFGGGQGFAAHPLEDRDGGFAQRVAAFHLLRRGGQFAAQRQPVDGWRDLGCGRGQVHGGEDNAPVRRNLMRRHAGGAGCRQS